MKKLTILTPFKFSTPKWVAGILFIGIPVLFSGFQFGFAVGISAFIALIYWGMPPIRMLISLPFLKSELKKVKDEATRAFVTFIGKQPQYIAIESVGNNGYISGTGLAADNGNVYLMENGDAISVPWEKVRSWSWKVAGSNMINNTTSPLSAEHVTDGIAINNANLRSLADAHNNSGFFVEVASIDNPSWHFKSQDENLLKKWYEIFNQLHENNGTIPVN